MPQNQARSTTAQASAGANTRATSTSSPNKRKNATEQRIRFVTGKGGVGKSLVAAAWARHESLQGNRVLLVEIGDKSYFEDFFKIPSVTHEPQFFAPVGFDIALWSGESCLREYVLYFLKLQALYQLFFENKVMRALINVAPGLNEVAILGKITSGIRKVGPRLDYDVIVVDGYATGHAMALLQAPKGMMEAIKFGPMGQHSREMEAVVQNSKVTQYTIATLMEELPVVETVEFNQKLKSEMGVEAEVVCNKVLQVPVTREELQPLTQEPSSIEEFSKYLMATLDRQKEFGAVLAKEFRVRRSLPTLFTSDPVELVRLAEENLRSRIEEGSAQ